nr:hypothetical protein CFP56_74800 [Quercus suber]
MFQGQQDGTDYSLTIPRTEIPKWFSHQNVGGSVNLQVPSDLLGDKLMGITVCAVFVFCKHHPLHQLRIKDNGDMRGKHTLWCSVGGFGRLGCILSDEFGKIKSYQLLLRYLSSRYFGANWKEILNQVDANRFNQIEVKFEPKGPSLKVTKCEAHLDGFEDLEKDTKIKRSRDDSDGEGVGPSGEATSNDVDEPHPKRIRLPNLIEKLISCLGNWLRNSSTQEQGDSEEDTAP